VCVYRPKALKPLSLAATDVATFCRLSFKRFLFCIYYGRPALITKPSSSCGERTVAASELISAVCLFPSARHNIAPKSPKRYSALRYPPPSLVCIVYIYIYIYLSNIVGWLEKRLKWLEYSSNPPPHTCLEMLNIFYLIHLKWYGSFKSLYHQLFLSHVNIVHV